MKKPISVFLAASIAIPTILTAISGCVNASAADIMTNGELLELINNKFGFEGYESSESYYASVPSNDIFFAAVQTAHEYEVLDELVTDFKTSDIVTREFFAMAASGAIYHDYTDEISINDISDITYKDDVLTVLNYGIMELDNGKFEPKEKMGTAECIALIDAAHDIWLNDTILKPTYEVKLNEGVIDLGGVGLYYYDENADEVKFDSSTYEQGLKKLSDNHFSYNTESGDVKLDSVSDFGIQVGSVMTVPVNDEMNPYDELKVVDIVQNSDGSYTLKTQPAEFKDYCENYVVEQNIVPDFTKINYIIDANGNKLPLSPEPQYEVAKGNTFNSIGELQMSDGMVHLDKSVQGDLLQDTGVSFSSSGVDVDTPFGKAHVAFGDNSVSFQLEFTPDESTSVFKTKFTDGSTMTETTKKSSRSTFTQTFKDIHFDYDAKLDWFKSYAKFVSHITSVQKFTNEGSYSKTTKICEVPYPTGIGDLTVNLEINVGLSISGELVVTLTRSNITNGFEFRIKGGLNVIRDPGEKTLDVDAKANMELTAGFNCYLSALGGILKAGVQPTLGAGANVNVETNHVPVSSEETAPLICMGVEVYPIFKIYVYATLDFLGKHTADHTFNILGKDNVMASFHIESFDMGLPEIVDECTKDRRMNQLKDEETAAAGVTVGTDIKLNTYKATTYIDSDLTVGITEVPSGYNYEDIVVCTSNSEVLTIDADDGGSTLYTRAVNKLSKMLTKSPVTVGTMGSFNCTAHGKSKGEANLTFKTKDGKYSATCDVVVLDPNEPIDYTVKLSTYGVTIGSGTCKRIEVVSLPWYLTEDDIVWMSDDSSIVTVDQSGTVTAVSDGYATITASTPDGTSKAYCNITVNNVGQMTLMFIPDTIIEYQI